MLAVRRGPRPGCFVRESHRRPRAKLGADRKLALKRLSFVILSSFVLRNGSFSCRRQETAIMSDEIPRTVHRDMQFEHGKAIGISNRWEKGQYCSILTKAGIVGCGIYDLETPAEFGQAIAIAKGTPACPLVEPEDLLDARIVGRTPQAAALGIRVGMTGREAAELMLQAGKRSAETRAGPAAGRLRVK